jgi:diguanylate cyclase (GGDEF)-like protein/PAS domain S-box-containing protein
VSTPVGSPPRRFGVGAWRAVVVAAPLLGVAAATTVLAQLIGPLAGAGAAVALTAGLYSARLTALALRIHRQTGSYGPCRGAGFLAVGVFATGLTGVALAVSVRGHAHHVVSGYLLAGGLALSLSGYLPAVLLVSAPNASAVVRLRRALDGLSVGVCLLFTLWLLLITPHGSVGVLGFGVSLLATSGLAMALLVGVAAARRRPAVMLCSLGVALSVASLAILAIVLANGEPGRWPLFCAGPLAAAPVFAFEGARRITLADDAGIPEPADSYAGYPILGVPVVSALAVAMYRLLTGGTFDRASVILGLAAASAVAVREALAALDVARYARRIARQEAHFRCLVAGSTDVTVVLDEELTVRWQSPAAARQFGLSDQDVVGRPFLTLLHPDDAAEAGDRLADIRSGIWAGPAEGRPALLAARLRDGFGQWRDTESTISDQRGVPEVGALVVHIRDVSDRTELEHAVRHLAYADQLTGLANRRPLPLAVSRLRDAPGGGRGALLLLELDGFTSVNDVRGLETGDAVLVEVARRIRVGAGDTGLLARLGGDEFAVVSEANPLQAYALATRLLTMLAEPYPLPGATVHLTASCGLTQITGTASVDEILSQADLALRRAKQLGRGRVEWYDEAMEEHLRRRMMVEQELPGVLGRGELDLVYQPVIDLRTECPVGMEALLRWRHPRLGTVLPGDLIPIAEQLGLIHEIGAWVLHQSCRQLSMWRRDGRDVWVAVNISPRQLDSVPPGGTNLVDLVTEALQAHGVPAERLVLEFAEDHLGRVSQPVAAQLASLRGIGLRTALDNFGAGPESLANLRRIPLDLIKLGPIFYAEAGRDGRRQIEAALPIIDVMVGLGRRLGMEVVAEGLEQPAHLALVIQAGARFGQGRLLARPEPAEHVEAFLDGYRARSV